MPKLKEHEILKKFLLGLEKGLANSLLIVGNAGIGKTETTLRGLRELGLKENQHFKYLNNYSTPLEFYHLLKEVNKLSSPRILIIDDGEEVIFNKRILGLLRSALWGNLEGRRIVHWISPRAKSHSFEFTGKIIILLNELNPKNGLVRALISRGFYYHLSLSNEKKLALMRERIKEPYKNLNFKDRWKILNYIEKIGRNSEKLTLRTLPMSYNIYILSKNHWKELIAELLI